MSFWSNKKVIVLGGGGFIGSHVTELLVEEEADVTVVVRSERSSNNLRKVKNKIKTVKKNLQSLDDCRNIIKGHDIVFNLAAKTGGVGHNAKHHARMFYDNASISTMLLEAAHLENVERCEYTSTADIYPGNCTIPTPESEGFKNEPELTSRGYGWAKRMAELQTQFYAEEYGMKISVIRVPGAYGPRDDFEKERCHVIPSFIMKTLEADSSISIWGSGEQTRAFIYVKDVARGILDVTEKYPTCKPVNIGPNEDISIKNLAEMIINILNKDLKIEFDLSKTVGFQRKLPDITLAKSIINWNPKYSLEEGLKETIGWYKESLN